MTETRPLVTASTQDEQSLRALMPTRSRPSAGLEEMVVGESSITLIDGLNGQLFFRGYDVSQFAGHAEYLAVVHLLWHGRWPTFSEQADLDLRVRARRSLPSVVSDLLPVFASARRNPMAGLRTAVSLLGALQPEAEPEAEAAIPSAVIEQATALLARLPTLVAALGRLRHGHQPIAPDPELGHAANYLYMLNGTRPAPAEANALNTLLILHMEHELNASTFAARTVTSTLSDYYSAITAAVGALKGRRHGGAIDRVPVMLRDIGSPEAVPAYVDRAVDVGRRLPGFGHRVYRQCDPRAALQADVVQCLSPDSAEVGLFPIAQRLEREMFERKRLPANVDYYAAVALERLGFPPALMTSFIVSARVAGWTAHILEQAADKRLIRPRARYLGPRGLRYTPDASARELRGKDTHA